MCGGGLLWKRVVKHKEKTLKQRFKVFSFGGALSTALELLSRHIVAAVRALQAEKWRHFGTFQPLLFVPFEPEKETDV